jgi:hypothetical protein
MFFLLFRDYQPQNAIVSHNNYIVKYETHFNRLF